MALTDDQRSEVDRIAELCIRRYMDYLFEKSLPRIIQAAIAGHDSGVDAHRMLFKRQWSMLRVALVAFAAGGGIAGIGWLGKLLGIL